MLNGIKYVCMHYGISWRDLLSGIQQTMALRRNIPILAKKICLHKFNYKNYFNRPSNSILHGAPYFASNQLNYSSLLLSLRLNVAKCKWKYSFKKTPLTPTIFALTVGFNICKNKIKISIKYLVLIYFTETANTPVSYIWAWYLLCYMGHWNKWTAPIFCVTGIINICHFLQIRK